VARTLCLAKPCSYSSTEFSAHRTFVVNKSTVNVARKITLNIALNLNMGHFPPLDGRHARGRCQECIAVHIIKFGVPYMSNTDNTISRKLVDILALLRGPDGCPWDREQTHDSLKRSLLEETYEVLEAIDRKDTANLLEELGDLLLQVLLHAQIAAESGEFTMDDVEECLRDKLVRRHPHVFGSTEVKNSKDAQNNWINIKRREVHLQKDPSILGKVPITTPALAYSQLIQDRASHAGFDWEAFDGVLEKVTEELKEIYLASSPEEKVHEFGDLMFAIVNAGRWLGIHVEDTMRQANARFSGRFMEMERLSNQQGKLFAALSKRQKDILWEQVKAQENKS
jgi:tetrapyrrole methylase family protein/MazG family protein